MRASTRRVEFGPQDRAETRPLADSVLVLYYRRSSAGLQKEFIGPPHLDVPEVPKEMPGSACALFYHDVTINNTNHLECSTYVKRGTSLDPQGGAPQRKPLIVLCLLTRRLRMNTRNPTLTPNPFSTAVPFWGQNYLEFEWFVPKRGLQYYQY